MLLSLPAHGEEAKIYRVGLLETTAASANRANLEALLRGLREAGYVEGKNLLIDYRSADGRSERFPQLARDLAGAKPDVIVARGSAAALAARNAGRFPVVMASSADPVGAGVVMNLARPGGSVTGLTAVLTELHGKRLQLIKEFLPGVKRVGFVINMANPAAATQWKEVERAARSLDLDPRLLDVRNSAGLERAIGQARQQGIGAVLASGEAITAANGRTVVDLAAKYRIPVVYSSREFVDAGGLVSYGVNYPHLYYRAASYVDKILKGASPADLPVEQPTKFELVIHVGTAQALGIPIPKELMLRADEVLQ